MKTEKYQNFTNFIKNIFPISQITSMSEKDANATKENDSVTNNKSKINKKLDLKNSNISPLTQNENYSVIVHILIITNFNN